MRSFCFILILFAFFTPVKLYATQQRPDYMMYNGKKYPIINGEKYPMLTPHGKQHPLDHGKQHSLRVGVLESYLEKANKWEWAQGYCTALYRKYYAIFEITNNELVLKDIGNCPGSLLEKFLSAFEVKDSIFKLNWFTGSIVFPVGKYLPVRNMILPFHLSEYYMILEFKNGILVKESRIGHMEYLSIYWKEHMELFKKESSEEYKQMERYGETKKETESKIKEEYKKRFGESISDFELTIEQVRFEFDSRDNNLKVIRTLNGAHASRLNRDAKENFRAELNMEEWLDFIRALYHRYASKWEEKQYGNWTEACKKWEPWNLFFYHSYKNESDRFYGYGCGVYPPDWNEFKKVIGGIEARIKKSGKNLFSSSDLTDL